MSDSVKAGLGPDTLSLIRNMVSEADTADTPSDRPAARPRAAVAQALPDAGPQPLQPDFARQMAHQSILRARKFRPSCRQILWATLALIVLLRPAWIVLMLVLGAFLILGVFVAFGADRVWSGAVDLLKWYIARAPERGARLVERMDRFACRWDKLLDRFPDGWVDGLYLPDLQSLLEADDRHDAVLATRLQRMQTQAADHEAAA
ncbi:hypothetical protein [Pseudosulfitobacter pseudonitzschiae]|uniref:hypothetical protein n=1 Tax=Pseudosulfitobacter pseudonitzschiae TaxID=1402135 RepID=UPI001AF29F06|nr:hypothetical protein [Pseudosulfitobacter pseudonitzschiae]MBM1816650.1 hypothetical protein [Pseudosulfitobacter pseudonitzschiae]MBM1833248.1 hypothetical protein [Pseudosulfitobacter pseudonitzschiae]MBM1838116.1 hypothetical protein [Pseudosulfitobacter pseudonitzschiae]MBM1843377.1 hypothetical protein [Pseudosulfitobacter pseudonitzschiae]MBM1848243.1 hypothetical protein [Pseudosulfitobacter pseudonitzschiae]